MAHSRVCSACGHDTCGTAPFIEPVYGLTVVRCAACSGVMVTRRWAGFVGWWRHARRVVDAAVVLGVQIASGLVAVAGLAMLSVGVAMELGRAGFDISSLLSGAGAETWERLAERARGRAAGPLAGLGFVGAFTGIWIGSMFGRRGVLRAFAVVAGLALVMSQVIAAVIRANSGAGGVFPGTTVADPAGTAMLLAAGLIVAGGFVPLGLGAGAALRLLRRNVIGTLVRMERRRRRR